MPDVVITADVLDRGPGPALSATSDMPTLVAPAAPEPASAATDAPAEGEAAIEDAATEGAEGEAGTEGDGEPVDPPEVTVEPAKPRRPGIQQRFSELTAEKKVEIAKREAAEAHAARLEKLLAEAVANKPPQQTEPPAPVEPPRAEPRPVRETFDTPEQYDEALIEWSTKRTLQIAQAEQEQHARAQKEAEARSDDAKARDDSYKAMQTTFAERRAAVLEAMPDYAEVAERDDLNIALPMALAIMQHEDGPKAAYYLGKHPELAEKISGMVIPGQVFPAGTPLAGQPVPDAQRQLIEMGKVFAAVSQAEAPPPPRVPPPPAPINPLRRGANAAVNKTLEEIGNEGSMEEYAARRMPNLQAERRPGVFGGQGTRVN